MYQDLLFLLAGIALLTIGGSYVTDGAVAIARKLNVSTMMIGLTVVAFGHLCPIWWCALHQGFPGSRNWRLAMWWERIYSMCF